MEGFECLEKKLKLEVVVSHSSSLAEVRQYKVSILWLVAGKTDG